MIDMIILMAYCVDLTTRWAYWRIIGPRNVAHFQVGSRETREAWHEFCQSRD